MRLDISTCPGLAVTAPSPMSLLTQYLVFSLREIHRPEVADLVLASAVTLMGRTLLIEPPPAWRTELQATEIRRWYEDLLTRAGYRIGLSIETTRLCPPAEEGEESGYGFAPAARGREVIPQ